MRTYSSPASYQVPDTGSLTDDIVGRVGENGAAIAFSRRVDGAWRDVTITEFRNDVIAAAKGLLAAGIEAGDRVAIVSRTRYEWTLLDYAIWWAGGVTVPVYETSSADQIEWILSDSGAVACIVETNDHVARIGSVRRSLTELHHLWSIDDGAVGTVSAMGQDVADHLLEERRAAVTPDDAATLIYTSGTTGRPKGCTLTHANFMFEIGVVTRELDELFNPDDASTLLFLPLAHIFARLIQVGCVHAGVRMGHTADVKELLTSFAEFQPTFILAVPRVFEKVFNSASQRAQVDGKGKVFDAAAETAIAFSRAQDGGRASLMLRGRHALFDRLVYKKLRSALGGRARYAVSGGAPLGERLTHFFRGIGVPVLEGYGLTETTAALTVNLPGETKVGTVGRPIPGTEVMVAEDGELLFRGRQVFVGYWQNQGATASALEPDGWFHTGDLGEVDHEGFVRITGRKKEILVTAGGKNVAPSMLEDQVRAHPLVSQCMAVGDGKPFIAALVTLDSEVLEPWAHQRSKTVDRRLATDPELRATIQSAVDEANAFVSQAESIRGFAILTEDWTEESGHLTPTLKLKRHLVMRDFHDDVERLYT